LTYVSFVIIVSGRQLVNQTLNGRRRGWRE